MELLKKLEETQRMMNFIQSLSEGSITIVPPTNSTTASLADSHRFLSHFLLFLKEPCGELSMDDKCHLISQLLPKVSTSFLEQPPENQPGQRTTLVGNSLSVDRVEKKDIDGGLVSGTHFNDTALIGLDAMQRANSTLEDFCRSYFMFHELDANMPRCIFKYLPVLSFTESYIYQLDSLNEKMVDAQRSRGIVLDEGSGGTFSSRENEFMKAFDSNPFQSLIFLLEHQGLLTNRIREELQLGEQYWALERKLCAALKQNIEILIEDVMRAIKLKSFDYRVLNLLMYQLRGEELM